MKNLFSSSHSLLFEVLIVLAVLGLLTGVMLLVIDPLEQLARGRDAAKQSIVTELSRGVGAYYTTQGVYPTEGVDWITKLQRTGEVKSIPGQIRALCLNDFYAQVGFCYQINEQFEAIIYTQAESKAFRSKAGCEDKEQVWIVWSSVVNKMGVVCTANATMYPGVGIRELK